MDYLHIGGHQQGLGHTVIGPVSSQPHVRCRNWQGWGEHRRSRLFHSVVQSRAGTVPLQHCVCVMVKPGGLPVTLPPGHTQPKISQSTARQHSVSPVSSRAPVRGLTAALAPLAGMAMPCSFHAVPSLLSVARGSQAEPLSPSRGYPNHVSGGSPGEGSCCLGTSREFSFMSQPSWSPYVGRAAGREVAHSSGLPRK